MKRALVLRSHILAALASGTALALASGCNGNERGAQPTAPAPPVHEPPPPGEPIAAAPTETASTPIEAPPPAPAPSPPPPANPEPVAKHPKPTPGKTCAKPTQRCLAPHQPVGQIGPAPGEYDRNGCLSGNRVSGACEGFYASSGPVFDGKQCCYVGCTGPVAPCGRPLIVAGSARVAAVESRADWSETFEALAERATLLEPGLRRTIADAWRTDALVEHASIASFSSFVLELLSVGVPSELVARAIDAARDEVRHAALCFGLAHALDGGATGPGALDVSGVRPSPTLAEIVARTVEEACCAETAGALLAAAELDRASDPSVRAALEEIAADEARHAELGWSFVAWALAHGGDEMRATIDVAFERGLMRLRAIAPPDIDARAVAFGRLGVAETRAVIVSAIVGVIEPARVALGATETKLG